MKGDKNINIFLSNYDEEIATTALKLREVLLANLPDIIEEVDLAAKMIAYSYGRKYAEMICTIIPSKKGIKLGFYKGRDLPDIHKLLEGAGKLSRYVKIKSKEQIQSAALKKLIKEALAAYKKRLSE